MSPATIEDHAHTLAVFAHELREPLGSILLAAHALNEAASDEHTHREMSNLIERQGRYLARLIDGALEGCRGAGGQITLRKEVFDLAPVVRDAVEAVAPMVKSSRHRFELFMPSEPLYLMADTLRMQQVLVNLLANAAKYTPPGGSIRLSVEACGEHMVIEVRDNGIGILPALLDRVFDLYEQGTTDPLSAEYSGLGVGLALVKSLVELHGGSVRASSAGGGAGSSFVVRLPVSPTSMPTRKLAASPMERSLPSSDPYLSDSSMLDA
jgi:signal transduction histidine kinase